MRSFDITPLIISIDQNQAKVPNAVYKCAAATGAHKRSLLAGVLTTEPGADPLYLFWMTNEELLRVHGVGNGDVVMFSVSKKLEPRYVKVNVIRRQYAFNTEETDCIHFPSATKLFACLSQVQQRLDTSKKVA